jgi:hypothetical protein
MRSSTKARDLPGRIAAGGYIFHTGWEKWHGGEDRARALQGMGAAAFPVLKSIEPAMFLKLLAGTEMALGGALLAPFVPTVLAGAGLTAFSGALVTMYLKTPSLRKPGSIWPNQNGIGIAKDVWLLGMGTGMVVDSVTTDDSC